MDEPDKIQTGDRRDGRSRGETDQKERPVIVAVGVAGLKLIK
jgi:hypothetical protein